MECISLLQGVVQRNVDIRQNFTLEEVNFEKQK